VQKEYAQTEKSTPKGSVDNTLQSGKQVIKMFEKTFVMLKPDAVQRGLCGKIISRIEEKGLEIIAMKFMKIPEKQAKIHYREHEGKSFFNDLIDYITSGPVVPMVIKGKNAISVCRTLMGKTDPQEALPGTIRGDFGMDKGKNLIHGSDSPESAAREISLFFREEEIVEYEHNQHGWVYE